MSIEAMKMALEALETCDAAHPSDGGRQWYDERLVEPAITALRAALAEPVQEPVAWMYEHDGMVHDALNPPIVAFNRWSTPVGEPYTETPLYTSLPQRKPLTDEEIRKIFFAELRALPSYPSAVEELPERLARAIERAHNIGS